MAEEAAQRKMKAAETKLRVSIKDLNDKCDNANDVNPSELWATRKIATAMATRDPGLMRWSRG